ncbi:MAG: TIGR02281 family clan AA aspartic protease [Rhizobiales bacterium]|nr:TIGR02281 family clan AA aspartic protease [Hyphomicrobiales bacterium]
MLRNISLLAFAVCGMALLPLVSQFAPGGAPQSVAPQVERQADTDAGAKMLRPAMVPAAANPLSSRKVLLDADARGHFTADFRLNGKRVAALVDTGATMLALNRSTARRVGIVLGDGAFNRSVDTANGRAKAAVAIVDRVEIGRISVENVQALVLEDKALSGVLVGMTFLNRLRAFQVEGGRLVMQQ